MLPDSAYLQRLSKRLASMTTFMGREAHVSWIGRIWYFSDDPAGMLYAVKVTYRGADEPAYYWLAPTPAPEPAASAISAFFTSAHPTEEPATCRLP